jgi:ketosteroid isomerase-like protein
MEQSHEVEGVLRRFYEAFNNGDITAMESVLSADPDVLVIGTDPDEWWVGRGRITSVLEQVAEAALGVVGGDVRGFAVGEIGWVRDQAKFVVSDGTEAPVRVTAICQREDGEWRIIQSHWSIGVPNEDFSLPSTKQP